MTKKQKAKAYDEALKLAREALNDGTISSNTIAYLQDIFPELKESEDERIRKWLLKFIQGIPDEGLDFHFYNLKKEQVIAWLEKQDDKHFSEPIKDYQGSFTCWNNAHDFRPKHLQRCICYDKYMCGVYCYVYDDISKYWCTQTTEEHDPDGDNHISDYADYRVPVWMPLPGISFYPSKSWLEKQGEKSSIRERYDKIKDSEWFKKTHENMSVDMDEPNGETKEQVDGFDAELNALLKKYEYLPKEELAECLEFYQKHLKQPTDAEIEKKDPILIRLDRIYDLLLEIRNNILRQPYIETYPPHPYPIQPWYDMGKVYCDKASTETTNQIGDESESKM